jgi:hypothetical protein
MIKSMFIIFLYLRTIILFLKIVKFVLRFHLHILDLKIDHIKAKFNQKRTDLLIFIPK